MGFTVEWFNTIICSQIVLSQVEVPRQAGSGEFFARVVIWKGSSMIDITQGKVIISSTKQD